MKTNQALRIGLVAVSLAVFLIALWGIQASAFKATASGPAKATVPKSLGDANAGPVQTKGSVGDSVKPKVLERVRGGACFTGCMAGCSAPTERTCENLCTRQCRR
jgi:hypothetical protein